MDAKVILVCGPPCAGKNYYVDQQRQRPGDVVLDRDALGGRAYNRAITGLEHTRPEGRAWVIACLPGAAKRRAFAARVRADEVLLLLPPESVLLARAQLRPMPHTQVKAVRTWLDEEALDPGLDPQPRTMTKW